MSEQQFQAEFDLERFIDSIDWNAMEDKYNEQFWDHMLSNEPKAHNEEWMLENFGDNFTEWVVETFDNKDIIFNQENRVSNYQTLRAINVNAHTEKKNNLTYLSWAWAVDQLLMQDPAATWSYGEPVKFGETLMVFCTVTAFGKSMTSQLPVMDYRNKAIPNPDSMAVNTAMQRCLAKAIALHGLGLYIYAGEDVPEEDKVQAPKAITPTAGAMENLDEESQQFIKDLAIDIIGDVAGGHIEDAYGKTTTLLNEEKLAVWTLLDSKTRSTLKKHAESLKGK